MWLKSEGFVDRVKQWWFAYQFSSSPSFVFTAKLKALKNGLKLWNKHSFGYISDRKKSLVEELRELEGY